MSISLDVHAPVSEAEAQLLADLICELFPLAAISDEGYLSSVNVVPRQTMASLVNGVLHQVGLPEAGYEAGPRATAVAVPIERHGHLTCFIVVAGELVQQLAPERYHPVELVSALLEELLHVSIYVTAWQQRGYLSPPTLADKERDIFAVCSIVHDEYIVSRRKASLAASTSLFDAPDQPECLTHGFLAYDGNLASMLDAAGQELNALRQQTIAGQLSTEESWSLLLRLIWRKVFDPLAREAGFRQGVPEAHRRPNSPLSSAFYRECVEPYWERALASLEQSYDSELEAMTASIGNLARVICEFMEDISASPAVGSDTPTTLRGERHR